MGTRTPCATPAAVAVGIAMLVTAACDVSEDPIGPPNVLIILVDTLRADHLALYGYDRDTAPFLSRAASEATVFLEARSQSGCTFPSVNSLLSSRPGSVFLATMNEHGWGIPTTVPSLPTVLESAGFDTFAVSSSPIVRQNPGPQNPDGGFGAGFRAFDDDCEREPAACVNGAAMTFLDNASEPFFGYLHYFDPHDPYQPPTDHRRVFAARTHPVEWVADGSLLPLYRWKYADGPVVDFDEAALAHSLDLYDDEIRYLDGQLEVLFAYLEGRGLLARTLIVLASDHGEAFMEHGDMFHCKDLTYDSIVATPLIFWVPGTGAGRRVPGAAQNLDIVPTVLDFAGISGDEYGFSGSSLRAAIEGDALPPRDVFVVQRYSRTIVSGRFKLIYNVVDETVQLYDLLADPGERTDIALRRPQIANRLLGRIARWMATVEMDVDLARQAEQAADASERLRSLGYLR